MLTLSPFQPIPGGQGAVISHFLLPELVMGAGERWGQGFSGASELTFSPSVSLLSSSAISHGCADTLILHEPQHTQSHVTMHQGLSLGGGRAGQSRASLLSYLGLSSPELPEMGSLGPTHSFSP